MDANLSQRLSQDSDGLMTYEYIANNISSLSSDEMNELIGNIISVDKKGQFVVSTARYLHAIDSEKFAVSIDRLIKAAIAKDRERAYLGDLAASIWGTDYQEHAEELCAHNDNFRRIYKRLYPVGF